MVVVITQLSLAALCQSRKSEVLDFFGWHNAAWLQRKMRLLKDVK